MGVFHEYIVRNLTPDQMEKERAKALREIGRLLNCEVFTYAARISPVLAPVRLPVSVLPEDILPFIDLIEGLSGDRIAVILETPGGSGEVGRDMVEILHEKFGHVMFIVPGMAKSTGTIMVLGGHEFFMGPGSALGPIDAQLQQDGKTYSADALIEGLNRIKEEVEKTGKLNSAYIPVLQRLSPGEIEHAHNALEFARATVTDWLIRYKFGKWETRETSGEQVTQDYKESRARDIAEKLASQSLWHTHGRSLRISDLRKLGLKVNDYSSDSNLNDAIQRYYVLLRMTFDAQNMFKIFETPDARVVRRFDLQGVAPKAQDKRNQSDLSKASNVKINVNCKCGSNYSLQVNLEENQLLQENSIAFPRNKVFSCPNCGTQHNLESLLSDIEKQAGRSAIFN